MCTQQQWHKCIKDRAEAATTCASLLFMLVQLAFIFYSLTEKLQKKTAAEQDHDDALSIPHSGRQQEYLYTANMVFLEGPAR